VYRCDTEGERVFVEVHAPTDEALQAVLHKFITRLEQAAHPSGGARQGAGPDHHGRRRQRFGRGPRTQALAGGRVYLSHRLRLARRPEGADGLRRDAPGRGLQADAVRRHRRIQLARSRALWCQRPPGAGATVPHHHAPRSGQKSACKPTPPDRSCSSSGTPWRDGTTHLVLRRDTNSPVDCLCHSKGPSSARARPASLSPLEFMQRLAALVPRPRLHLIRLAFPHPTPSCARWWRRRNPNHPRRPYRRPGARRPVRTTARFG